MKVLQAGAPPAIDETPPWPIGEELHCEACGFRGEIEEEDAASGLFSFEHRPTVYFSMPCPNAPACANRLVLTTTEDDDADGNR